MSYEMLRPIISIYAENLGASGTEIGLVYSALVLSAMALRFPVGHWVDRRGRRIMLLIGTIIYTIAPLLYSVCTNPAQLVAVRIFHGVGMATFQTASMAMVADMVPRNRLGEAMGIFAISFGTAMSLGPAIVGFLLDVLGFTQTFYVFAVFAFFSFLTVARMHEVTGVWQKGSGRFRDVLTDVNVLTASTGVFFTAFVWGAIVVFLPVYIYSVLGIAAWGVGAFFSVFAVCSIITRPVFGRLSDRRGRIQVLFPCMTLAVVAMFALGTIQELWHFLLLAVIFGLGEGPVHSILNAMNLDTVSPMQRGIALAMFLSLMELGMAMGAISMGFVVENMGITSVFPVAAVTMAGGMVMMILVRRFALKRTRAKGAGV